MAQTKKVKGESVQPETTRRIMPQFTLTIKDLPEIKDWDVGGKYRLAVRVEMVSKSKVEEYEATKGRKLRARFQIVEVGLARSETLKEKIARIRSGGE